MSRQVECDLPDVVDSRDALIEALVSMGFPRWSIEVGKFVLEGYDGSTRETTGQGLVTDVEIRIKRDVVGRVSAFTRGDPAGLVTEPHASILEERGEAYNVLYKGLSNDLGFYWRDGSYRMSCSDYDRPIFNEAWSEKLSQFHNAHKAVAEAANHGFTDFEVDWEMQGVDGVLEFVVNVAGTKWD